MENSKIVLKEIISDKAISIYKIKFSKYGGSGYYKTSEKFKKSMLCLFWVKAT